MIAAAALAFAAALTASAGTVQIAILRQAASAPLVPEGRIMIEQPGGKPKPLEWKGELNLRPREGGLRLAELRLKTETRLIPAEGGRIRVGSNFYRGTLILRLDIGQTLTIVEEADVEEYLEGVLPHEMDANWPIEALKAQAVVARTFTYANMGKFRKDGFDLTNDTRSQVYKGMTSINENVRSAVRQTRGEVLGYEGKLLSVYYHACCGGATTDAGAAWGGKAGNTPRPLRGVRDPWCSKSPHMRWIAYFAWPDLTAAVSERRMLSEPLKSLRIGARDAAGYVRTFLLKSGGESVEIKASELRHSLGAGDMKSVRIRNVNLLKKGVEFVGGGSGHGVGLCQWGARLQADKGRSYTKILSFYFPASVLSEVDE